MSDTRTHLIALKPIDNEDFSRYLNNPEDRKPFIITIDQDGKCYNHQGELLITEHILIVMKDDILYGIPNGGCDINKYDLVSMSDLPDSDPDQAKINTIYLSETGDYIVRDTEGNVQQGKINDKNDENNENNENNENGNDKPSKNNFYLFSRQLGGACNLTLKNNTSIPHKKIDLQNLENKLKDKQFKLSILKITSEAGYTAHVYHHSYLVAGEPVQAAGYIKTTRDGEIEFISNESGHYKPTLEETMHFLKYLDTAIKNDRVKEEIQFENHSKVVKRKIQTFKFTVRHFFDFDEEQFEFDDDENLKDLLIDVTRYNCMGQKVSTTNYSYGQPESTTYYSSEQPQEPQEEIVGYNNKSVVPLAPY